jgi:hypothetical protein
MIKATVLFDSIDVVKKEATFLVNGNPVTRGIVEDTPSDKLEEHVRLMGEGLSDEFKALEPLSLDLFTITKGEDLTPKVIANINEVAPLGK